MLKEHVNSARISSDDIDKVFADADPRWDDYSPAGMPDATTQAFARLCLGGIRPDRPDWEARVLKRIELAFRMRTFQEAWNAAVADRPARLFHQCDGWPADTLVPAIMRKIKARVSALKQMFALDPDTEN